MLESFEVASTAPCAGRPYAWVCGTARFAVDPLDAANARIVDLTEALRDPDGRVRFDADVRMLRPTAERNGRALVVIPNRGMLGGVPFSLDAEMAMDATAVPDPGDGLLLDRGWTIAWCGWQFDVQRDGGWLGLSAPAASAGPGWLRVEFRPDQEVADHRLSDSSLLFRFQDYPPVELDDAEAKLYVRTTPMGRGRLLPRAAWSSSTAASRRSTTTSWSTGPPSPRWWGAGSWLCGTSRRGWEGTTTRCSASGCPSQVASFASSSSTG